MTNGFNNKISQNSDFVNTKVKNQTETLQFKRWMGKKTPENAVLWNEDGTPKVFYHGTGANFNAFSFDELGSREGSFFFSESEEEARAYGENVLPVYLSASNLANYDEQDSEFYHLRDKRQQVKYLKERGYDGWYSDMDSGGYGEVSVFSPAQIKSATDNNGMFSGYDDNIYRMKAPTENVESMSTEEMLKRLNKTEKELQKSKRLIESRDKLIEVLKEDMRRGGTRYVSRKDCGAVIKSMVAQFRLSLNARQINDCTQRLGRIFDMMLDPGRQSNPAAQYESFADGEEKSQMGMDEIQELCNDMIAMSSKTRKLSQDPEYKGLAKTIRKTYYINADQKANLISYLGTKNWVREVRGYVNFTTDPARGVPLDTAWYGDISPELGEKFDSYKGDNTHMADQAVVVYNIARELFADIHYNTFEDYMYSAEGAADRDPNMILANTLFDKFFEVREVDTIASARNEGVVGVCVLYGDKNRVHSMRVLAPNGKEFEIKTNTTTANDGSTKDGVDPPTKVVSKDSISQSNEDVNTKAKKMKAPIENVESMSTEEIVAWMKAESERAVNAVDETGQTTSPKFYKQIENWDGKTIGFSFVVGRPSAALISAGIPDTVIKWDASKILKTLQKHDFGIDIDVIKKVPEILENPIVVVDSKSISSRKVVIGDVVDKNNKTVVVVMELNPTSKKGNTLSGITKIASSQGRSHIESLLKSTIRYIDPDINRVRNWLNVNRLRLPLRSTDPNSNESITNYSPNVNTQAKKMKAPIENVESMSTEEIVAWMNAESERADTEWAVRKETEEALSASKRKIKDQAKVIKELRSAVKDRADRYLKSDDVKKLLNEVYNDTGIYISKNKKGELASRLGVAFNGLIDFSSGMDNITDADPVQYAVSRISEFAESVIAEAKNKDGFEVDSGELTDMLLDRFFDIYDEKVIAQVHESGYMEARWELKEAIEAERQALREERAQLARERGKAESETKRAEKAIERVQREKLRKRVKQLYKKLSTLVTVGGKTGKSYIPNSIYAQIASICSTINFSTNYDSGIAKKIEMLREKMTALAQVTGSEDSELATEYAIVGEDIVNELNELYKKLEALYENNEGAVFKMDNDTLSEVVSTLESVVGCIAQANELIDDAEGRSISEVKNEFARQQNSGKLAKRTAGKWVKAHENVLNTVRAMRYLDDYLDDGVFSGLVKGVEDGTIKERELIMRTKKMRQELETRRHGRDYWDFTNTLVDTGLKDRFGNPVYMTHAEIVQVIMTHNREAASGYRHEHLQKGGIILNEKRGNYRGRVVNAAMSAAGKGRYYRASKQTIRHIGMNEVNTLNSLLNDYDRDYMAVAEKIFGDVCARANDEYLFKMFHRHFLPSKDYIPYKVYDREKNKADESVKRDRSIENAPSLHEVTPGAGQALVIDGVDSVIDSHVAEIAHRYGVAVPLRNLKKVYFAWYNNESDGDRTVRETIERTFGIGFSGKKSGDIINQTIVDIEAGRERGAHGFLDDVYSKSIKATLTFNLGVAMKQAASLEATSIYLDRRAIWRVRRNVYARLLGVSLKRITGEIDKYTPLHFERRLGLSSQELAEMNKHSSAQFRLTMRLPGFPLNGTKWIQMVDVATTAAIWQGCKTQINKEIARENKERIFFHKGDKKTIEAYGSDAYFKRVAELYNRTMFDTQPMYDTLHRTEMMKKDGLWRIYSMYKTVPYQNLGIAVDSFNKMVADGRHYGIASSEFKKSFITCLKAYKGLLASALHFVILGGIANGLIFRRSKDWRDRYGDLTVDSVLNELCEETVENFISNLTPFVPFDLIDKAERLSNDVFDTTFSTNAYSNSGFDIFNTLSKPIDGAINLFKNIKDEDSKDSMLVRVFKRNAIPSIVEGLAELWGGIPLGNVRKLSRGIGTYIVGNAKSKFIEDLKKMDAIADERIKDSQYCMKIYDLICNEEKEKAAEARRVAREAGVSGKDIAAGVKKLLVDDDRLAEYADELYHHATPDWSKRAENKRQELLDMGFTEPEVDGARDKYIDKMYGEEKEDDPNSEPKEVNRYNYSDTVNMMFDCVAGGGALDAEHDKYFTDALEYWKAERPKGWKTGVTTAAKKIYFDPALDEHTRDAFEDLLIKTFGYSHSQITGWNNPYEEDE